MTDLILHARGFGYRYPDAEGDALRRVDLAVRPGEFVVLAGRSGSGKTTLLRAGCGLVPHYYGGEASGRLEVAGLDVRTSGPAELGGEVGFVAQEPESQVVSATVRSELELPLEIRGEPAAARARAVEEVALALGIAELLPRATAGLSGGELQRVALAAALVLRPRLILLDEPTSQLDPVAGDELIWLLRRLNEEWGMTVVLAEHRLERCLPAADRVVALSEGGVAFDGLPEPFLDWATRWDPTLATPAARMFALAGLWPLPAGVRRARELLGARGLDFPRVAAAASFPRDGARPRGEKPTAALEARRLWVTLGEPPAEVLRGVDLRISAGERVVLMGRNGAGKTTLLRSAAGLLDPVRGRISTPGGCALLSQNPADFLVADRVGAEFDGDDGRPILELLGLAGVQERDPRDLSGGERQRLALALVMAGRDAPGAAPQLICLDEPTRGMDRAGKAELVAWLERLAQAGSAIVVATHEVELAASFADRVLLLGEGELIADAPPGEVLSGGWYFATEVARVLGGRGPVSPEDGADWLRDSLSALSEAAVSS